ncbi:MAG: hypothetical protein PHI71_01215 [Acidiphilium sp.]|jgi:hypothetical protein|nr:hypothetical protein [Acidiphilium sp.]
MRLSSISLLAVLIAVPAFAQSAAPSPDATLWASASKSAAGALQLYLGQYPHGQFAGQAKAALAALNAGPAASPAPATKTAPSPAVSKPANLKPGWLVEVRVMHRQATSSGHTWLPDPVALALKPQPGPVFNVADLARGIPGAGPLPAIAGSAKWLVKKAGQWGIGTDIKWHNTGPCTATVTVQGNRVIKSTTNQVSYAPGSGDTSFSAALSLTPGVYDVAWALICQPNGTLGGNLPGKDATLSLLVAPPQGALAAPAPGAFVYQPNK